MGRKNLGVNNQTLVLKKARGMTLIEVVVVIAILGILILLAALTIKPFLQLSKARDSRRKSDLNKLVTVLEDYVSDHGCFPKAAVWESEIKAYMSQVPKDPKTKQSYLYTCPAEDCGNSSGCSRFVIYATLESEEGTYYGGRGNYAVSSGNYRAVAEPTPTLGAGGGGGPVATATPTQVPSGGLFWGCFSGVCKPIAGREVCPNRNYGLPDCGRKCGSPSDPQNECY